MEEDDRGLSDRSPSDGRDNGARGGAVDSIDDGEEAVAAVAEGEEVAEGEDEDEEDEDEDEPFVAPRKRGSHNPHDEETGTGTFLSLFHDTHGVPIAVTRASDIPIVAQRQLWTEVQLKAKVVPEWVVFTKHGMACSTCT
jgi:hypothetical protein